MALTPKPIPLHDRIFLTRDPTRPGRYLYVQLFTDPDAFHETITIVFGHHYYVNNWKTAIELYLRLDLTEEVLEAMREGLILAGHLTPDCR